MQKRGGGAIVNQSSTAAYLYSGFYGLAKVGINSLTQQLAHELGGMNIRVNAIAPGPVDTEATRTQAGDVAKDIVRNSLAIKRMGQTDDMVGALPVPALRRVVVGHRPDPGGRRRPDVPALTMR